MSARKPLEPWSVVRDGQVLSTHTFLREADAAAKDAGEGAEVKYRSS